jgi:anti-sigma factor (TIGR02949 family)
MTCSEIESRLAPYVDGLASPEDAAHVDRHLATCAACRDAVRMERTARELIAARRASLTTPAPPGLRTRLAALMREGHAPAPGRWRARLLTASASLAAAILVVVLFELVSPRSNVLYAAQLAIDHVRCLFIDIGAIPSDNAQTLKDAIAREYGWAVPVPASDPGTGLQLVAARRCPIGVGPHAHLMYRVGSHDLSLYITPNQMHAADQLHVLGHQQRLWNADGHTFAVVSRGLPADALDRVEAYLKQATVQ